MLCACTLASPALHPTSAQLTQFPGLDRPSFTHTVTCQSFLRSSLAFRAFYGSIETTPQVHAAQLTHSSTYNCPSLQWRRLEPRIFFCCRVLQHCLRPKPFSGPRSSLNPLS
ncbi:hypothetical protein FIBSPDRAFT_609752 [Athelia psychrophila]|uniref:Uncharacterized protein n=1 Tax=Athelia psychrophila TaxID=1759441 RepID=A0A166BJ10_9AGAM|nr:hypothetical protein FIBSPDRAFT_151549 [Fibularhizoctonia sp. CBS 109695]KZP17914.1 hypothetical protein FIBSPDRAFT_609752 [Fibularhizoctonia sp. CBS 109695]